MSIAVMAIGIPGSGKTTVLKPLAERYGLAYISRDDIREELFGDARVQSGNREVWEESNRRAAAALAEGQGVILDSTFVERGKRQDAVRFLREAGAARVIGAFAPVPLEEAKQRNAARDRVVPDTVIDWMHGKLAEHPPSAEEGFDALYAFEQLAALEEELAG